MSENIYALELGSGEWIAFSCTEITQIPKDSVIRAEYPPETDLEAEYRSSFAGLASEIFQNYKNIISQNPSAQIAAEILWLTEAVSNQPYKAKIRMFLMIRALSADRPSSENIAQRITNTCKDFLGLKRYSVQDTDHESIKSLINSVCTDCAAALVKEESEEFLNNQMLNACYSFDLFGSYAYDLSSITNALIQHPGCAFSVQLIPSQLSGPEAQVISQVSQVLDTLSKGVMTQGIGQVSYSAADKLAAVYKYYQDNKNSAMFIYNAVVFGDGAAVDDIASKIHGYISYSAQAASVRQLDIKESDIQFKNNIYAYPWIAQEVIMASGRNPSLCAYQNSPYASLYRMPYLITAEEASGLFRLPLGNSRISAGLPVNESESAGKTYADNLINAGDIEIGELKSSPGDTIGISLRDLAKHMLVVGTPGSGKTTFSVSLLDRLWKEHHIPFLVIEPAKNEYRALIQSIPELQVFTPGKNFISPFVYNPFVPPKNVRLETYKSTLKTAFEAGVSMASPLDKIFEEAINNCYSDFRWLDTYTSDDKGKIFNIADFINCFKYTVDDIGYTGDARNIGRAGVVRLNSLSNLFDNYYSIPIEDLLSKPTIIELAAIENSDQKALIISLLLLSILSYVNANYVGEGGLKNVILLEEAHVLLDADSNSGDSNPAQIAQGLVKRMLAEIRSYGVGLIIADQSPRKVSTDVVALTDMKVVFRIVEATDKQIVSDSMNMSEAKYERLSRLKPGEAFLFFNRLEEPEEVITPDYRLENNISISLSDESIKELSTYWNDKADKLRPYPECEKVRFCSHTCNYEQRILAREISRRIFVKYFKADMKTFEPVKKVFGQISRLIKEELNDEPFTPELLSCVKVQLWRRIRYGTKIPVRDIQIENSLKK